MRIDRQIWIVKQLLYGVLERYTWLHATNCQCGHYVRIGRCKSNLFYWYYPIELCIRTAYELNGRAQLALNKQRNRNRISSSAMRCPIDGQRSEKVKIVYLLCTQIRCEQCVCAWLAGWTMMNGNIDLTIDHYCDILRFVFANRIGFKLPERSKSIDLAASPWRQRMKMLSDSFGPSSLIEVVNSQPVNFLTLYTFSFRINHTQLDALAHTHIKYLFCRLVTLWPPSKSIQRYTFASIPLWQSIVLPFFSYFFSSSLSLLSGVLPSSETHDSWTH